MKLKNLTKVIQLNSQLTAIENAFLTLSKIDAYKKAERDITPFVSGHTVFYNIVLPVEEIEAILHRHQERVKKELEGLGVED